MSTAGHGGGAAGRDSVPAKRMSRHVIVISRVDMATIDYLPHHGPPVKPRMIADRQRSRCPPISASLGTSQKRTAQSRHRPRFRALDARDDRRAAAAFTLASESATA